MSQPIGVALFIVFALLPVLDTRAQETDSPAPAAAAQAGEAADQGLGMALMSATVDINGTLIRGGGAVSVAYQVSGIYDVKFNRSVEDCSCVASFGKSDGGDLGYFVQNDVTANCPFGSANDVRVRTVLNGAFMPAPFHLIVFCPK